MDDFSEPHWDNMQQPEPMEHDDDVDYQGPLNQVLSGSCMLCPHSNILQLEMSYHETGSCSLMGPFDLVLYARCRLCARYFHVNCLIENYRLNDDITFSNLTEEGEYSCYSCDQLSFV